VYALQFRIILGELLLRALQIRENGRVFVLKRALALLVSEYISDGNRTRADNDPACSVAHMHVTSERMHIYIHAYAHAVTWTASSYVHISIAYDALRCKRNEKWRLEKARIMKVLIRICHTDVSDARVRSSRN
jgi:hypothetical protein